MQPRVLRKLAKTEEKTFQRQILLTPPFKKAQVKREFCEFSQGVLKISVQPTFLEKIGKSLKTKLKIIKY